MLTGFVDHNCMNGKTIFDRNVQFEDYILNPYGSNDSHSTERKTGFSGP